MRVLVSLIAVTLFVLLLSFAGALHPVGDSFAVFRVFFALCLAAGAMALIVVYRRLFWGLGLGVIAGLAVFSTHLAIGKVAEAGPGGLMLYQKNMLWNGDDRAEFQQEIRSLAPDFFTGQEVSFRNRRVLRELSDVFPSLHMCNQGSPVGSVAVASKYPIIPGKLLCEGPVAAMQVSAPSGPVWVVSAHWEWPFPFDQASSAKSTQDILSQLSGPMVFAGDLNMVPWSHSVQSVTTAAGLTRVGPRYSSFYFRGWWPLTIDHVFARGVGQTVRRDLLGSDHYGLLAQIKLF